jgi:hypothetical protein
MTLSIYEAILTETFFLHPPFGISLLALSKQKKRSLL